MGKPKYVITVESLEDIADITTHGPAGSIMLRAVRVGDSTEPGEGAWKEGAKP